MDGIVAYILSKKFTKDTVIGMGAIKGAACQVQSINKVNKTTTITLKWEDNVGTSHTQSFNIEDGLDGVSVQSATIDNKGHLKLTLSDGTVLDCGQVLPQYDTMPSPSATNVGQILQYIGSTTPTYTNGYFYECINDSGTYKWVEKLVQDSYTKAQIGDLSSLPDTDKDVIENIRTLKLSIDELQASKLSISDIDDALSDSSENPVQNKVIKLTLDQLRGSILNRLDDKEDRFRYSTMPLPKMDDVGKIVEYIGDTDSTYTNGYFYQCRYDGTNYIWVQKNVQPSSGGTGGDGVVDGYYNSTDNLFYEESTYINPITGDNNTLYVSLDTNLLYRYNGAIFIRVDESGSGENDVINGYYNSVDGKFYEESTYITEITGETGKIYISIDTNIQYRWDNISVPNKFVTISSDIEVDDELSNTSENPVQNKVIKIELDKLSASMLSGSLKEKLVKLEPIYLIGSGLNLDRTTGELTASGIDVPIDDHLDDTSVNPVQNKVIALTIEQLQGSVLDKIRKRLDAQGDDFAIWDNNGEVVDSGISKDIIPSSASSSNKVLVKSDIDDALSDTSENPVQNKKITVPLQALQGSVANIKLDIADLQASILNKQDKLIEGDGIDINGTNTISVDISYLTASRLGFIPDSEKGEPSGVAELNSSGKVPSSQLPSYVDDVVDGYLYDSTHFYEEQVIGGYYNSVDGNFYEDSGYTILITPVLGKYYLDIPTGDTYEWDGTGSYVSATPTRILGESGKIYISVDTNIQYRWTGTAFAALGGALQLGETDSTAYRGDRGKIAYDHSQITDGSNPHQTKADVVNLKVPIPALSGSKLDVESTLHGANTELNKKQNIRIALPISTLSGSLLQEVEPILHEFNTEITDINNEVVKKVDYDRLKDTVGWVSKNLLEVPTTITTQEINGVTFTFNRNSDNEVTSIVVNGTPDTGTNSFIDITLLMQSDADLILTGCPSGGSSSTYKLCLADSDGRIISGIEQDTGSGAHVGVVSGKFKAQIRIYENYTANNLTFYPMLRRAEISDSTFEPYHKSVDYELWNGEVTPSKNLFKNEAIPLTGTNNNGVACILNNDGSVTAKGTPTGIIRYYFSGGYGTNNNLSKIPPELIGKEITVSANITQDNGNMEISCFTMSDETTDIIDHNIPNGQTEVTFTVESNAKFFRFYAIMDRNNSHSRVNAVFKPMMRYSADTDDTYEPYYKPLKDSKYSHTENNILGAKNLLKVTAESGTTFGIDYIINDGVVIANSGTCASNGQLYLANFTFKANVEYILSGCPTAPDALGDQMWIGVYVEGGSSASSSYEYTATQNSQVRIRYSEDTTRIIRLRMLQNFVIVDPIVFKPMIRLAEDADNTFAPYAMTNKELTDAVIQGVQWGNPYT